MEREIVFSFSGSRRILRAFWSLVVVPTVVSIVGCNLGWASNCDWFVNRRSGPMFRLGPMSSVLTARLMRPLTRFEETDAGTDR